MEMQKRSKKVQSQFLHSNSASFFGNNSRHGDGGGTDQLLQNAMFGKHGDKDVFGSDFMKLKDGSSILWSSKKEK